MHTWHFAAPSQSALINASSLISRNEPWIQSINHCTNECRRHRVRAELKLMETHTESAQLWNDWRTCELSDAFSWLFNSVTGCLAIDSESWLAVGGSAGICVLGSCVFVREHACIHNGQNIPSCCRGISPPLRNGTSDRAPGITPIAVVLMQCHTLLLCLCLSLYSLWARLCIGFWTVGTFHHEGNVSICPCPTAAGRDCALCWWSEHSYLHAVSE